MSRSFYSNILFSSLLLITSVALFSSRSFAVTDNCASECTDRCESEVQDAEVELAGHYHTCRGEDPGPATSECGRACSFGCKNFMRGQKSIIEKYYDYCGGGTGAFGRLECVEKNSQYYASNTQNSLILGDGHTLKESCEETIETKNYNLFCAKTGGGYAVLSFITGDKLGVSVPFLDSCNEFMDSIKHDKICVKDLGDQYKAYDIRTLDSVSSKSFPFLTSCLSSL